MQCLFVPDMMIAGDHYTRVAYHQMASLGYGDVPDFYAGTTNQVSAVWEPVFLKRLRPDPDQKFLLSNKSKVPRPKRYCRRTQLSSLASSAGGVRSSASRETMTSL